MYSSLVINHHGDPLPVAVTAWFFQPSNPSNFGRHGIRIGDGFHDYMHASIISCRTDAIPEGGVAVHCHTYALSHCLLVLVYVFLRFWFLESTR